MRRMSCSWKRDDTLLRVQIEGRCVMHGARDRARRRWGGFAVVGASSGPQNSKKMREDDWGEGGER